MQPLRSVSLHMRRPRPLASSSYSLSRQSRRHFQPRTTQLQCNLLARAYSDDAAAAAAIDPSGKWQQHQHKQSSQLNGLAHASSSVLAKEEEDGKEEEQKQAAAADHDHFAGTLTSGASHHPFQSNDDHDGYDIDFTTSRLGYAAYEQQEGQNPDEIREESREVATAKAERILAILRHSMTELDIGHVIHRISQFATTPRVTHQSRKQFLKALQDRFGANHEREHEILLAFLLGKDHVIDQLKVESRDTMDVLATQQRDEFGQREVLVPEIMGLHPELVANPTFVGVVFYYCRLACLNSQKLVRPPHGQQRRPKSSLLQVKHDFRRVLDSEGLSHFAEMMGVKGESPREQHVDVVGSVDAEWDEFNLENDRIDFRMLVAQMEELILLMKQELSDETITKMLIAMLASLKTTKLHRKIFQEMVCNIQAALPEKSHERVLTQLVPFLSGNQATYDDFETGASSVALQHHRLRHEAILRALLETRMRLGHILIHDLDAIDPMASISSKLQPDVREKVITTAWNIVSVLNDREYHVFFSRFLKHKLAWRPSRATFGETFLEDVRKTLGPRKAEVIMPLFEEIYLHLSVETLTICRVKLRHSKKLLREAAVLKALDDAGQKRLETSWKQSHSVFYRNLPHGVTEKHLRQALDHIGKVKKFMFFRNPINGPPDDIDDEEGENGKDQGEDDDDDVVDDMDADDDDDDDDDGGLELDDGVVIDPEIAAKQQEKADLEKRRKLNRKTKTPRKKEHVIASDIKTPYSVLVEFEDANGQARALLQALQIFGVMMAGWKQNRPVFASSSDERASISIQDIPYGTTIDALLEEMQAVLKESGLSVELHSALPRGVVVTNGRVELRFASFTEAANVVEVLQSYTAKFKSRRELSGEDKYLNVARQRRRALQQKEMKADERKAKKEAKDKESDAKKAAKEGKTGETGEAVETAPQAFSSSSSASSRTSTSSSSSRPAKSSLHAHLKYHSGGDDDDELDHDEDEEDAEDDDDDEDERNGNRKECDETEDEYFAEEEERERLMAAEDKALQELPRPFDVTWNRVPRAKNKHMFV